MSDPALASPPAPFEGFTHRHLLGIEGLTPSEISALLDRSESYVELNRGAAKKQNYAGQLRLGDTEQFTAEITFFAPDGAA